MCYPACLPLSICLSIHLLLSYYRVAWTSFEVALKPRLVSNLSSSYRSIPSAGTPRVCCPCCLSFPSFSSPLRLKSCLKLSCLALQCFPAHSSGVSLGFPLVICGSLSSFWVILPLAYKPALISADINQSRPTPFFWSLLPTPSSTKPYFSVILCRKKPESVLCSLPFSWVH